jgi:hypothetical protein
MNEQKGNKESQETFLPGAENIDSVEPLDEKLITDAIECIGGVANTISDDKDISWELLRERVRDAERKFIEQRKLPPPQAKKLGALFDVGMLMLRNARREREKNVRKELKQIEPKTRHERTQELWKKTLAREQEEAMWQQHMATFILGHRDTPKLKILIDKFWVPFERLSETTTHNTEFIEKERRGIERVVTATRVFETLGYTVETSTGRHDVEHAMDMVVRRETPHGDETLLIQVKPLRAPQRDAGELIGIKVFFPLPSQSEDIPPAVWNLIEWTRKNQQHHPNTKLIPCLLEIPSALDYPDAIEEGTGLPNPTYLDNSKKIVLDKLQHLDTQHEEAPKTKKRRTIYVPKK